MALSKRFKIPAPGTILEPAENPWAAPLSALDQNDVLQYEQAAALDAAFTKNQTLAADYLNQFNNTWLPAYNSGRLAGPRGEGDPDAPPPTPPPSMKVLVVRNEDWSTGYQQIPIGPPVCAVPSYTKIPPPQVWDAVDQIQRSVPVKV